MKITIKSIKPIFLALTLGVLSLQFSFHSVHAASVVRMEPQGTANQIEQIRLRFDEPMIALGEQADASVPVQIKCDLGSSPKLSGQWNSPRDWSAYLNITGRGRELIKAGETCTVQLRADLKSVAGNRVSGTTQFKFKWAAPLIQSIQSGNRGQIEEQQHFKLSINASVDNASVEQFAYCAVSGLGEKIPLKVVSAIKPDVKNKNSDSLDSVDLEVRCQRPLPPASKVSLVWAAGIKSSSGSVLGADQRFEFEVRPKFKVDISCLREKAQAPCSPLSPITVQFSDSVPLALLNAIKLERDGKTIAPEPTDEKFAASALRFRGPFVDSQPLTLNIPKDLKDESGRSLTNQALFPLKVAIDRAPALLKFANESFGILELNAQPALPVTVRRIDTSAGADQSGWIKSAVTRDDATVLAWRNTLDTYSRDAIQTGSDAKGKPIYTETRRLSAWASLGASANNERKLAVPQSKAADKPDANSSEVLGIPMTEPGFYIVEAQSKNLGAALLGAEQNMYVRTSVLVTNMGVHFKEGTSASLAWVTALDSGKPIANATIRLVSQACNGAVAHTAQTDKNGLAKIDGSISDLLIKVCPNSNAGAYMVSAALGADYSFVLPSWNEGIQPWRFNMPSGRRQAQEALLVHSIVDRSLVRAGETVSMKHFVRSELPTGLANVQASALAPTAQIVHSGSEQSYSIPIQWQNARSGVSQFVVPKQAKLGDYSVNIMVNGKPLNAGNFKVGEFRLPLLAGRLAVGAAASGAKPSANIPTELAIDVKLGYLSGGPASDLDVLLTGAVSQIYPAVDPRWQRFSFSVSENESSGDGEASPTKVFADQVPLKLNTQGTGQTSLKGLPQLAYPYRAQIEASFLDPNGENQTLSAQELVWPSSVAVGILLDHWAGVKGKVKIKVASLKTKAGSSLEPLDQIQPGTKLVVSAVERKVFSTRKRLVGGFYSYEHSDSQSEAVKVCEGIADSNGLFECDAPVASGKGTGFNGEIIFTVKASDAQAKVSTASASAWVSGGGEIWFDADSQDRIDVLPERKAYKAGETAVFQVRSPFRYANALVAIERENVIDTMVIPITGTDPTIKVPVKAEYAPNVFVSVLALRGRLRSVPWYSVFVWGWKDPAQWWREFRAGDEPPQATAMVDLAKPTYKFGVGQISIQDDAKKLAVTVTTDQPRYDIRSTVKATIKVTRADGKPLPADTQISLAAVDAALLELQDNQTWNLYGALWRDRLWGVSTFTAQSQVIGRRHFGRKVGPNGGGGGQAGARELFDTLLVWQPTVTLNENGQANIEFKTNDALSEFKIQVAADSVEQQFGFGQASFKTTQDLQIVAGLPPLVRQQDSFNAALTLRNNTPAPMSIEWQAKATGDASKGVAAQSGKVEIAANSAQEINWLVDFTQRAVSAGRQELIWEFSAKDTKTSKTDVLKFTQTISPSVIPTVLAAVVNQLEPQKPFSLAVTAPAGALTYNDGSSTKIAGGVRIYLNASLLDGMASMQDWFKNYPYACLEQRFTRSAGLRDVSLWQNMVKELPNYLDADGLASYYPIDPIRNSYGSDVLTAHMLSLSHELAQMDPRFVLDADSIKKMQSGLIKIVTGKAKMNGWSYKPDQPFRRLAAIEALARSGLARPEYLDTIEPMSDKTPTHSLLDWLSIAHYSPKWTQSPKIRDTAMNLLRARMVYNGTRLDFSTEDTDRWWWLMVDGDRNVARLLSYAIDQRDWVEDVPKVIAGMMGRSGTGYWSTTTSNLMASVAFEKFSRKFESVPVGGITQFDLQSATVKSNGGQLDWAKVPAVAPAPKSGMSPIKEAAAQLSWLEGNNTVNVLHNGTGKPWLTVQALAAVPLKGAMNRGYEIAKTISVVSAKKAGVISRGDVMRIKLEVRARVDANWVVIDDPIAAGSTIMGGGSLRDSTIAQTRATQTPNGTNAATEYSNEPTFVERSFEAYRGYFNFLNSGLTTIEYTIRINNPGVFKLPNTRVQAMYNPELFGMLPNAQVQVLP
jgi:alpha-2-macroglobulin